MNPPSDWNAQAIRELRDLLGDTQAELATRLGVSKRTVEGWEVDRRVPGGPVKVLLEQLRREATEP